MSTAILTLGVESIFCDEFADFGNEGLKMVTDPFNYSSSPPRPLPFHCRTPPQKTRSRASSQVTPKQKAVRAGESLSEMSWSKKPKSLADENRRSANGNGVSIQSRAYSSPKRLVEAAKAARSLSYGHATPPKKHASPIKLSPCGAPSRSFTGQFELTGDFAMIKPSTPPSARTRPLPRLSSPVRSARRTSEQTDSKPRLDECYNSEMHRVINGAVGPSPPAKPSKSTVTVMALFEKPLSRPIVKPPTPLNLESHEKNDARMEDEMCLLSHSTDATALSSNPSIAVPNPEKDENVGVIEEEARFVRKHNKATQPISVISSDSSALQLPQKAPGMNSTSLCSGKADTHMVESTFENKTNATSSRMQKVLGPKIPLPSGISKASEMNAASMLQSVTLSASWASGALVNDVKSRRKAHQVLADCDKEAPRKSDGVGLGPAFGDDIVMAPLNPATPSPSAQGPKVSRRNSSSSKVSNDRPGREKSSSSKGSSGLNIQGISAEHLPKVKNESRAFLGQESPPFLSASSINDSPASSTSSVPSIVITPPPIVSSTPRYCAASFISPFPNSPSFKEDSTSDLKDIGIASGLGVSFFCEDPLPPSLALDDSLSSSIVEIPSENNPQVWREGALLEARAREDEEAFGELALEIDWLLSDFLNMRSPGQAWTLASKMVKLLEMAMSPQPQPACPILHGKGQAQALPSPPSLKGIPIEWPNEERLPDSNNGHAGREEIEEMLRAAMMEKVFEHIVTGISCLLADTRSPYEAPLSIARLCSVIKCSFTAPVQMVVVRKGPMASDTLTHGSRIDFKQKIRNWQQDMDLKTIGSTLGQTLPANQGAEVDGTGHRFRPKTLSPAELFMTLLEAELLKALDKGEEVKDRSRCLEVPAARKNGKRKHSMSSATITEREKDLELLLKGGITEEEWRRKERRKAATGDVKDEFISIDGVRFVGELYKLGLIGPDMVHTWLDRLLFETVYPGVPSMWELECACALLITAGRSLEEDSVNDRIEEKISPIKHDIWASSSSPSTPGRRGISDVSTRVFPHKYISGALETPSPPKRNDSAPAHHWINSLPSPANRRPKSPGRRFSGCGTPTLGGSANASSQGITAEHVLITAFKRLDELIDHDDIDNSTKCWLREVTALRARGWRAPDENEREEAFSGFESYY
ncbi:hypothetical protein IE53DRAFT_367130 [Violaceomyces palustris]|uniref:Uncharacterized protein n=1 Tax=Violaceomyces palustris TaxID=1673888 RepID=A0ACD0P3A5_9BASI|nr:hypothetical protein IE53DRAFT_367130 [Violaceomyces palustris]